MKVRDLLKRLRNDGWFLDRTRGITVNSDTDKGRNGHGSGHPSDDVRPKTL